MRHTTLLFDSFPFCSTDRLACRIVSSFVPRVATDVTLWLTPHCLLHATSREYHDTEKEQFGKKGGYRLQAS
jgi:hypothetical protein